MSDECKSVWGRITEGGRPPVPFEEVRAAPRDSESLWEPVEGGITGEAWEANGQVAYPGYVHRFYPTPDGEWRFFWAGE